MKPIHRDIGSFLKIRTVEPRMPYVDKTAYQHKKDIFDGRRDLVADRACCTYIFESRKDKPVTVAMDQATSKNYAEHFVAAGKTVRIVALSFDRETRRFTEGTAEQIR